MWTSYCIPTVHPCYIGPYSSPYSLRSPAHNTLTKLGRMPATYLVECHSLMVSLHWGLMAFVLGLDSKLTLPGLKFSALLTRGRHSDNCELVNCEHNTALRREMAALSHSGGYQWKGPGVSRGWEGSFSEADSYYLDRLPIALLTLESRVFLRSEKAMG